MNRNLIAAAVLSLGCGAAWAAGTTGEEPANHPVKGIESPAPAVRTGTHEAAPGHDAVARAEPFATFDDNHDGLISGDELDDIKDLKLAKVDRNRDGRISPAEFEAAGPFEQKGLIQKARDALGSIGDGHDTRTTR